MKTIVSPKLEFVPEEPGAGRGAEDLDDIIMLEQESEERRKIFEASLDLILVVDKRGEVLQVSPISASILDFTPEEMIGCSAAQFVFPEDLDRTRAEMRAVRRGRALRNFESRYVSKSGRPVPLQWNGVWSEPEQRYYFIGRNIEEAKKAEARLLQSMAELKRSNEELAQFANIASHDLQEPLRMVASYTQLLARRYKGRLDADADEFIAFAVDGANRMQRLIQDLLAYSRVGTKDAALGDVASEQALTLALANLHSTIEESGAQVTLDALPVVRADELQLTQLFQNLVGNGIKYQKGGAPKIHVSAAPAGEGKWSFSVRDNGIGIDVQDFEKIFGMFQRLHGRGEFAGTGIGLAICKKIVERHGGSITVESQPGQGSTFRFTLMASAANQ
jgi:PAS domain S-box-containing protein